MYGTVLYSCLISFLKFLTFYPCFSASSAVVFSIENTTASPKTFFQLKIQLPHPKRFLPVLNQCCGSASLDGDLDPDPAFHFKADPDLDTTFLSEADPYQDPVPTFQFDPDPDPTTHFSQISTLLCSKITL